MLENSWHHHNYLDHCISSLHLYILSLSVLFTTSSIRQALFLLPLLLLHFFDTKKIRWGFLIHCLVVDICSCFVFSSVWISFKSNETIFLFLSYKKGIEQSLDTFHYFF
ncbi:unnamed protein product [Cuscuta campestris]|uniref:Uncharacterized protein n=1 Tax=Cuscuta campestris TaxID=132261 RepID=A0A484NF61_9ASTE|nr:unnamed protein product [Cuscuta campestris]